MREFRLNGDLWRVVEVSPRDPLLVDRTGRITVATTDPLRKMVYVARGLSTSFREKVIVHEIGHCAAVSFGLLTIISSVVPRSKQIAVEEWLCNYMVEIGPEIKRAAEEVLDHEIW